MRFHEKLFLVKEILGATSAELARGSELDPSSISRYLGARHKPARYGTAVAQIAAGAAKLADCDKTTHELRKVAGADKDEVLYDA
ncbi:MAG: hypothetical protein RR340_06395, partial [Cloacibacillus sp.]